MDHPVNAVLMFGVVVNPVDDVAYIDVAGEEIALNLPYGYAPAEGDIVWLLRVGRRYVPIGVNKPALYDNTRTFDAPLTFDGAA